MNYANIKYNSIANGIGCRTDLFVSGCSHHCKGCFNECTWDFNYGNPFTKEVEDIIIESLSPVYINGISILGGEPMELSNQKVLYPFLKRVKNESPRSSVWVYSGYTFEELMDKQNKRCHGEYTEKILSIIDILVDGEFMIDKKNISLRFRGSSNQRIINIPKSLSLQEVVLSDYMSKS